MRFPDAETDTHQRARLTPPNLGVRLRIKGVPTRLVYFPDENHWILKPQNSRLWHREVFAWLDKYIGQGPTK